MFKFTFLISNVAVILQSVNVYAQSKCGSSFGCISSLTQEDCGISEFYKNNVTMDGCCPGCVKAIGYPGLGCSRIPCAPGMTCSRLHRKCLLDGNSCFYTKHLPATVQYKPVCTEDQKFAAKQCRGDIISGRCFCYSETGERIFGWSWWIDAKDMTCACSRRRHNLEKAGRIDVTLHCDQNGNYEELQCDSGICWCADPKTGGIQDNTVAVPDGLWTYLPCYNQTMHGDSYLRQCESVSFAQNTMKLKFEIRGTNNVDFKQILCDYDGSFGTYTIEWGVAYCTWRDGNKIGAFQAPQPDAHLLDCYCARDSKIFNNHGLVLTLACGAYGNYVPKQEQNRRYFCVDHDGFAVSPLFDTMDIKCSDYIYYEKLAEMNIQANYN